VSDSFDAAMSPYALGCAAQAACALWAVRVVRSIDARLHERARRASQAP
jgi:hypothetical protein